jgi:uroporphyrinogen decarboxylase
MCLGAWEVAAAETRAVLAAAGTEPGHVFNLGHGVLPETDPGILEQVVDLVHAEGRAGVDQ